jgi:hypothetical protein
MDITAIKQESLYGKKLELVKGVPKHSVAVNRTIAMVVTQDPLWIWPFFIKASEVAKKASKNIPPRPIITYLNKNRTIPKRANKTIKTKLAPIKRVSCSFSLIEQESKMSFEG